MSGSKPQRPQPQYAPHMSGPASSAFTPLGFQGVHSSGLQPGAQNSAYPDITLATSLGFFLPQQGLGQGQEGARSAPAAAPSGKAESKAASSAYASRHQAAEQRRRTRINERLDRLRQLVPHAERANTASFLEEVIHYIEELQAILGLSPQQRPPAGMAPPPQQKQPDYSQLFPGDLNAAATAGGGVTPAAYAALLQQQQQAQQMGRMTAEQASALAMSGFHGGGPGVHGILDGMLGNGHQQGVHADSGGTGINLNAAVGGPGTLDGGDGDKAEDEVRMGHDLSLGPGGHKRADPGTPNPSGPMGGAQGTDSDGSGGRPPKKRSNR